MSNKYKFNDLNCLSFLENFLQFFWQRIAINISVKIPTEKALLSKNNEITEINEFLKTELNISANLNYYMLFLYKQLFKLH